MRPILRAEWSESALCRHTAEDQVSKKRRGRRRRSRCQNGARPQFPPPLSMRTLCAAAPGDACATISSIFPTGCRKGSVISNHCGAKSFAFHQVSRSPSVAKPCVLPPAETSTNPWSTMFASERLWCVAGMVCAVLLGWKGTQEVTRNAANAIICFIQRPLGTYRFRIRLTGRLRNMPAVCSCVVLPGAVTELELSARIFNDHVYPRTTFFRTGCDASCSLGESLPYWTDLQAISQVESP